MNINRVVLSGNLTADPDERALPSGTSVTRLRLAVNTRRKNGSSGDWEDYVSALRFVKLRGDLWAGLDG